MLELVGDWKLFLSDSDEEDVNKIRGHERTGRALGKDTFFDVLENNLQRVVKLKKGVQEEIR